MDDLIQIGPLQKRGPSRLPEFEYQHTDDSAHAGEEYSMPGGLTQAETIEARVMNVFSQKFTNIESELRNLKSEPTTDTKLGNSIDPQKLQGALNDWLAKVEVHLNDIEEKVALQASEMSAIEKRVDTNLRQKIKDFSQQTQDYVQAAISEMPRVTS